MIYYERKLLGRRIRLNEHEHSELLKRFDPEYAKRTPSLHRIDIPCPLCDTETRSCHYGCAFYGLQGIRFGCLAVIRNRVGKLTTSTLSIGPCDVTWKLYDDTEARHRLKRIREELKKFKRVEA